MQQLKTAPTRPDRSRLSAVEGLLRSITSSNQRSPEPPRHSSFINPLSHIAEFPHGLLVFC
jgi:hypothetical protein